MKKLWAASILSYAGSGDLSELENVSQILSEGSDFNDPLLATVSPAWSRLMQNRSELISALSYGRFVFAVERAMSEGIQFTYPGLIDYPKNFLQLQDMPLFLTYLGSPIWNQSASLAVVGSREPGSLSQDWCEQELPKILQQLPLYFVSGGARGVDQIAHRLCLRAEKPTVAVLPSGLRQIYPPNLNSWVQPLVRAGGALLSEFSPGMEMKKHHFRRRNRLIAGLSLSCLLVEARRKSGTLLTAQHCLEQSKPLFVLPSHPLEVGNLGALDLLCDGATPVRDAEELIMFLSSELRWHEVSKMDIGHDGHMTH